MNKSVNFLFILILLIFPVMLFAQQSSEIIIVNHFNVPLVFTPTINPDVLPALPLTVPEGESVNTAILDLNKEVYINVDDNHSNYAFFGIQFVNNNITFYGYLSSGISYSWHDNVITFCQSYTFRKMGKCM